MSGVPIARVLQTQWILFGALAASIVVYGVVVLVAIQGEPVPIDTTLRWILAAAAVLTTVAVLSLRRARLPRLVEDETPYHREQLHGPLERVPEAVAARLQTAYILTWALSESVALFGLVLAFVGQKPAEYWPFGFAALLLILTNPPTRGRLESAARAAE